MSIKKPQILPLNNLVLGRLVKSESQTKSGIFLPQTTEKRLEFTTVLAVGPDVERVKVGQNVIYKNYTQSEVTHDGVEYILVEEGDILAEIAG